ncbi:MFS sugar transporter-like protein [Lophiotrema nucula]|uniref:MFS sugar transporter-like protein n=1 Tax=Lophiotrema nucula TaxID=690887 RepID=A0A6A5YEW0_9PLEO|nr:MFS sugar transporter-like protein [Lophiotrema nucula]
MKPSTLGKLRAYWLGTVVCMGGFLFGYDSGIVGGVLTLQSFVSSFDYDTRHKTRVNSLAVGLQQLGAFVACFGAWPLTNRLGRRVALMLSSAVFVVGAIIQTVDTHSMGAFYAGRIIAGIGLGAATVVVPTYSSEMTPKELRGQIGSFFQLMYTIGIFTSYWVDYAWQIPIGLQIVPAAFLGLGMLTLKESTRWLTQKGRHEEAWESLKWVRASDAQDIADEMGEIRTGVEIEERETEGFRFKELLEGPNFKRIFTAFAVFTAQQATGATAFAYFGPQYFKLLVGGGDKDLLLTAIFGAIKVAACGTFVLFLSERVGRRQISTAAVVKNILAPDQGNVTSSGIATVALIYLFVIAYNFSWGPLPWPYVSEIFPTRIREPGVAIGVSSQWLFNFVFSLVTPYMIDDLGRGTFTFWGLADATIAIGTFFFLKETKGLSLEEIAHNDYGQAKDFKVVDAEYAERVSAK